MHSTKPGTILVVDDEADVRRVIADILEDAGYVVETAADAESSFDLLDRGDIDLAFIDINLPGASGFDILDDVKRRGGATDVVVITGKATVANAIEATRRGAYEYVTKPFDLERILELTRRILEGRALGRSIQHQRAGKAESGAAAGKIEIVGQSPAMQEVYKIIGRMAGTPTTVLIQGESGTGKEVVAKAIHDYSTRAAGPFVAVNCSAIPADLLESEMFGHERGAFTGATERRIGKFEQAKGGTLFLDEISDMPLPLQAKLLRVLQEREFSRVGGHELIPAECRIVAATNKQLEAEVEAGRFREDLYFRLKVVVIELPALRERRADIPLLVQYFIDRINEREHFNVKGVSAPAMGLLLEHPWRGNVRELENILLRAAALAPDRVLTPEDLPLSRKSPRAQADDGLPLAEVLAARIREYMAGFGTAEPRDLHARVLAMVEKPLFEAVLEATGGNQLKAADMLGINRNTLRKKITDYAIALPRGRT
ncbi:MAG: sigma-54-dependent Fis family transcriptional regulator [Deltaproteobacteria bacterium]|nr:sigma-54-dependent Fis family transcriptional regulator [Deltaproteobacteria bacterium]